MTQITLLGGTERRRRWGDDERRRILVAAFTPGAVVLDVARQFEVSTSLIYKWRKQTSVGERVATFAPAVLLPAPAMAEPPASAPAITIKLANGTRLRIGAQASAALVTAALQALR